MSKRVENINALRQSSPISLAEQLQEQRRKLFEVRFQQATGQVENHRQVRELRHQIARILTAQVEARQAEAVAARGTEG